MWGTLPLTNDSTFKGHLQTLQCSSVGPRATVRLVVCFIAAHVESEGFTVASVTPGNCDVNCACLSVFLLASPEAADDEGADALLLERLQHLLSCSAEPWPHINTHCVSFSVCVTHSWLCMLLLWGELAVFVYVYIKTLQATCTKELQAFGRQKVGGCVLSRTCMCTFVHSLNVSVFTFWRVWGSLCLGSALSSCIVVWQPWAYESSPVSTPQ